MKENYLFLGNPGAGKSTLINCLIGRPVVQSGVSYGDGLTRFSQTYEHDGKIYMDTPSLADRSLLKQAAEAITTSIKQSGTYKIFFVIRLQNGRVFADDLATIETVMSSIDLEEVPFTIIINNVNKRQYDFLMKEEDALRRLVTLVNAGKYTTPHIVLIPTLLELDEEDNAIAALPYQAAHFIKQEAPSVVIEAEVVSKIKADTFMRVVSELREQLQSLHQDSDAFHRRMKTLQEKPGFFRDPSTISDTSAELVQPAGRSSAGAADVVCPECDWIASCGDFFCRRCGFYLPTDAVFA